MLLETKNTFYNNKKINASRNRTAINIYAPSNKTTKYMKQKLTELNGETEKSAIAEDVHIPLSITDRTKRQKIRKDTENLNNAIDQLDLSFIILHPPKQQNTHTFQTHMEHRPYARL